MRITGGKYKNKHVKTPKGQEVRPTSAKVRESIFNIIQLCEEGTIFYEGETAMLDLFAGSGIMGLEVLSRGAKKVVFIERSPRHAAVIKKNINNISVGADTQVCPDKSGEHTGSPLLMISDALRALDKLGKTEQRFNFIFIDPPYLSDLYEPVLQKIKENNILSEEGFIVVEYAVNRHSERPVDAWESQGFILYKSKTYGDTGLAFLTH